MIMIVQAEFENGIEDKNYDKIISKYKYKYKYKYKTTKYQKNRQIINKKEYKYKYKYKKSISNFQCAPKTEMELMKMMLKNRV